MMKGQLAGLMRQAQQMQDKLKKAQEALAELTVEGQSGSGLVKVVMTGKHQLRSVTIDPSLMTSDPDDRETLQDLITAAINEAVNKVESESSSRMSAATAGMPLPPGFKL
jgi:DNA-binding YbaB/EbfC family protein